MVKHLILFVFAIIAYIGLRLISEHYSDADHQFLWGWMSGVFVAGCVKIFMKDD